jgi:hypothetical protein
MHRAVGVGANCEGGADAPAINDDGCLGGFARQGWLGIRVLDDSFDLPNVCKLDGSGPPLFQAAPTILDLHHPRMGCYLTVDMSLDLAVIARGVEALCGIWANRKSFLLAPRRHAARVESSPFGFKPPLHGKLRQSTSDSASWQQLRPNFRFILNRNLDRGSKLAPARVPCEVPK